MFDALWSPWGELNPFEELEGYRLRFDRLFDELGRDRQSRATLPRTNVYDTGASFVLEAELPGFRHEDLSVSVDRNVLTLSGGSPEEGKKDWSAHRRERAPLKFSRSFSLPARIDAERVQASLKEGVLTIDLPKASEAKPRQITVKAN